MVLIEGGKTEVTDLAIEHDDRCIGLQECQYAIEIGDDHLVRRFRLGRIGIESEPLRPEQEIADARFELRGD